MSHFILITCLYDKENLTFHEHRSWKMWGFLAFHKNQQQQQ